MVIAGAFDTELTEHTYQCPLVRNARFALSDAFVEVDTSIVQVTLSHPFRSVWTHFDITT